MKRCDERLIRQIGTRAGGGGAVATAAFADGDLSALVNGSYVDTFAIVAGDLVIAYSSTEQTNGLDGYNDAVPKRTFDLTAAGFSLTSGHDLVVDVDLTGFTSNGDYAGLGLAVINDEATPAGVGVYILDHFASGSKRYGDLTPSSLAVRGSIDFKKIRARFTVNEETVNCLIAGKMTSTDTWERLDEFYEQGPLMTGGTGQLYLQVSSVRSGGTGALTGRTDTYGLTYALVPIPVLP